MTYATHGGKNIAPVLAALQQPSKRYPAYSQQSRPVGPDDAEGGGEGEQSQPFAGGSQTGSTFELPKGYKGQGIGAVKAAASQLGKPYVFGSGPDTSSFDCSDLIQWSYKQIGVNIPRDTYGQMKVLPPKSWADLQPGDPIYRKNGGHVVLYAGNGKVLAAPHTGANVQYQPLSNFPQSEYQPYQIVKPNRR
jgi:cell wall-associated NlpC family hydrolase